MEPSNDRPKKVLRSVITAKGSEYTYLPDGRTQRFKSATNELHDPQDVLLFIPPFALIKDQAVQFYPKIFTGIENEVQFEQLILQYAQRPGKTVRPVDDKGRDIFTNEQAKQSHRVFLQFVNTTDSAESFNLPVSIVPKPGYYSFDTRKFKNEKNETYRERHIGNKVVQINFEEQSESLKNNQLNNPTYI